MSTQTDPVFEAYGGLLGLFVTLTELPAGLFRRVNDNHVAGFTCGDANFSQYCRTLHRLGGREHCDRDHEIRASKALAEGRDQLSLCHAGMWNQSVPITIGKDTQSAALLYGQLRIGDPDFQKQSLERHATLKQKLNLSAADMKELESAFHGARVLGRSEVDRILTNLLQATAALRKLYDAEDLIQISMDRVTHEIQTRLQAVIANSENLSSRCLHLTQDVVAKEAAGVLQSALALDAVIQTLGDYLQEYKFRGESLQLLVDAAQKVFSAEAEQRGIGIRVNLASLKSDHVHKTGVASIEMSKPHLQHAINNLIHNAVKYSFRSGPDRDRFVDIRGQAEADEYCIVIINYGVGITQEEIDEGLIFRRNYQGKLTVGEYRTGSGKGLYFVKQVVERHHGRITIESRPATTADLNRARLPHLNIVRLYLPIKQPPGATTFAAS
jgi:signal transduction histidine kinase